MAEAIIAQGHVLGLRKPDNEKAPAKAFVGGYEVVVFRNKSEFKVLEEASDSKTPVKVALNPEQGKFGLQHILVKIKTDGLDEQAVADGDAKSQQRMSSKGGRGGAPKTPDERAEIIAQALHKEAIQAFAAGTLRREDIKGFLMEQVPVFFEFKSELLKGLGAKS